MLTNDDTLVLRKPEDIQVVVEKCNSFHSNLKFTFDDFADGNVHFFDQAISLIMASQFTGKTRSCDSFFKL